MIYLGPRRAARPPGPAGGRAETHYVCVCIYIYIYTYIYTYQCIHTYVCIYIYICLSSPKPGHTTGGSGRRSARRGGGAGRDADGSVRPEDNRLSYLPDHRRRLSWTFPRKREQPKSYVNRWRNTTSVWHVSKSYNDERMSVHERMSICKPMGEQHVIYPNYIRMVGNDFLEFVRAFKPHTPNSSRIPR